MTMSTPTTLFTYAGFDYFANNTDNYLTQDSKNAIQQMADMGANTVTLDWNMFQQDATSNILNDYSWEGSTAGLGAVTDYIHSLGLKVAFKPQIVNLTGGL